MKSITILFAAAVFATVCHATWNPSDEEVKLSTKEDARDIALFKLMTPSAEEVKLSAKEDARDIALFKLLTQ